MDMDMTEAGPSTSIVHVHCADNVPLAAVTTASLLKTWGFPEFIEDFHGLFLSLFFSRTVVLFL